MVTDEARSMLLELADLLDALPPGRFDYGRWVGAEWEGQPDLACGTTACAGGWATTLASFKERGLFLSRETGEPTVVVPGGTAGAAEALAEVLDITSIDAISLFIPDKRHVALGLSAPPRNASAHEVAEHIRTWLRIEQASAAEHDNSSKGRR